jgi:hypothetical protein
MVFIKKLSLHGIFFSGLEILVSVSDPAFIELLLQSLVWLIPLVARTGKDLNQFLILMLEESEYNSGGSCLLHISDRIEWRLFWADILLVYFLFCKGGSSSIYPLKIELEQFRVRADSCHIASFLRIGRFFRGAFILIHFVENFGFILARIFLWFFIFFGHVRKRNHHNL